MTNAAFDVTAIGNALVDVIADATEDFLAAHHITKSSMTLIDAERAEAFIKVAVSRRGVEYHFYKAVPAGSMREGEVR